MSESTHFFEYNSDNPHFLVDGFVNDQCCNDSLVITSTEYELCRHLKENGFEAVVFYDYIYKSYCYDYESYKLLKGKKNNITGAALHDDENLTADSPLGLDEDMYQTEVGNHNNTIPENRYHSANMEEPFVWNEITNLVKQNRTAVVFSNVNSLSGDLFSQYAYNFLTQFGMVAKVNNSVVIHMYHGVASAELCHQASYVGGNGPLSRFVTAFIMPIIENKDENHIITLGPPNAAEIRNLIHSKAALDYGTSNCKLLIDIKDVEKCAARIAYGASVENMDLNSIIKRMDKYMAANPYERMTIANCHKFIGLKSCQTAMEQLDDLVGLETVKQRLKTMYDSAVNKSGFNIWHIPENSSRFAPKHTIPGYGFSLNQCIMGPAGTGKTTIAQLIVKIYYEAGILPTAHLENANDIKRSEGRGEAARRVTEHMQRAVGGAFFLDEAYQISEERNPELGSEATTQLTEEMGNLEGKLAVILAGYEEPLRSMIKDNAGLKSRFSNNFFVLEEYTGAEIKKIIELKAQHSGKDVDFTLPDGSDWLDNFCQNLVDDHDTDWGNGRVAENIFTSLCQNFEADAKNMSAVKEGKYRLTPVYLDDAYKKYTALRTADLDVAIEKLKEEIGLNTAKEVLFDICTNRRWLASPGYSNEPGCYALIGPPGTGKTYFAEHMMEIFYFMHIIKRRKLVSISAGQLVTRYEMERRRTSRHTSKGTVEDIVKSAENGMIFIDEAHQLTDTQTGNEILRQLVPLIEDPDIRSKTCFVLGGYLDEMEKLFASDQGLDSRFTKENRILFTHYTHDELTKLLKLFMEEKGYIANDKYLERTSVLLSYMLDTLPDNYGDARFMRKEYLVKSEKKHFSNLNIEYCDSPDGKNIVPHEEIVKKAIETDGWEEILTFTENDIPDEYVAFAGPVGKDGRVMPPQSSKTRIDALYGKEDIKELLKALKSADKSPEFFDGKPSSGLHYVIAGPKGSGRHFVARCIASVLFENGALKNERPQSRSKGNFEGRYVGETIPKTNSVINSLKGSMMIVENPISMLPRSASDNTYGVEAMNTILQATSSTDMSIVFIDTVENAKTVMDSFNGMRESTRYIELDDILPDDMLKIFKDLTKYNMVFEPTLAGLLPSFFTNWVSSKGGLIDNSSTWANASELNNVIETIKQNWENTPLREKATNEFGIEARLITAEMFPEKLRKYLVETRVSKETVMDELEKLNGLESVKTMIHKVERRIRNTEKKFVIPGSYVFAGNPGTGKTKVARILGAVLQATGALSQGHVVERAASEFCFDPDYFNESLKCAKNGILFIDEAHQLCETAGGREVIRRLVKSLEDINVTKNTSIVLAGYTAEMQRLMDEDAGLNSRFGNGSNIIYFDDYSVDDLVEIMKDMAANPHKYPEIGTTHELTLESEYIIKATQIFNAVVLSKNRNFGNARFVRNFLRDSYDLMLEHTEDAGVTYVLTENEIPENCAAYIKSAPTSQISSAKITTVADSRFVKDPLDYFKRVCVFVSVSQSGSGDSGTGSGVIISNDGIVLTCAHVVEKAASVRVRVDFPDNKGLQRMWFDAEVMKPWDSDHDIALLKIKGSGFDYASVAPKGTQLNGLDNVFLCGFPLGLIFTGNNDTVELSPREGKVIASQKSRVENITLSIEAHPGDSGAPVFSEKGQIVGLLRGAFGNGNPVPTMIPIKYFWENFIE